MSLCRLDEVTAEYRPGKPVLFEVSFEVLPGCTALVGANGTGKSTIVELIAGSLRPTVGHVTVGGLPAHDPAARGMRAVCRGTPSLYPALTVQEHLELYRAAAPDSARGMPVRLDRYGLTPWMGTPVSELSTGNLRKAWIILTTAPPVDLIVLDEPFSGLDSLGADCLLAEIEEWVRAGRTVLVVAHHPHEGLSRAVTCTVRLPSADSGSSTPSMLEVP